MIQLDGLQLTGEAFSCTGHQLALVVASLRSVASDCVWFVADLEAQGYSLPPAWINAHTPIMFGATDELAAFAEGVPQFLAGVFLAAPSARLPPVWSRSFWTDDEPFEELDGTILEIRAFDTSWIEVYADEEARLHGLAQRFGGAIVRAG
jgi:hypothetical protein